MIGAGIRGSYHRSCIRKFVPWFTYEIKVHVIPTRENNSVIVCAVFRTCCFDE